MINKYNVNRINLSNLVTGKKLPEIISNPESWLELKPRKELGDNLYAIELLEAFRAMVTVHKRKNVFLFHHPNKIVYSLTNNDYHGEYSPVATFMPKEISGIEEYLHNGSSTGYKGIELKGYGSSHPLVRELIKLRKNESSTRVLIGNLEVKLSDSKKKLSNSKKDFKQKFLPKELF